VDIGNVGFGNAVMFQQSVESTEIGSFVYLPNLRNSFRREYF